MITIDTLIIYKQNKTKITMLTCYDACFAQLLDHSGIDMLLVGDSLGMVVQGKKSTLPVTLKEMCYHTECVARNVNNALIVSDLPFGSYETNPEKAYHAAVKLMKSGANMVKLEGGEQQAATTAFLQSRSIPVCAHIGLTPQAVNILSGYKVQGRGEKGQQLINDAKAHEQAGATLVLMECVPSQLAQEVTAQLSCPTIGIGAGPHCDGQVLVLHDMLGIFPGKSAKFVKNFMIDQPSIASAITNYIEQVKTGQFPDNKHSFE